MQVLRGNLYESTPRRLAAAMFASDPPVPLDEAKAVSTLIQRLSHRMGKATSLKDEAGHID